jgi:hypothetical protein
MYYYKTDLRTNGSIARWAWTCQNNVRGSAKDFADHQHATFSVGLVDGLMTYQSDYRHRRPATCQHKSRH